MKHLLLLCLSLLVALPTSADEVKDACTDLVLDYAYYRDRFAPLPYGELFTEDAVLTVLGEVAKGREAIRERLVKAEPTQVIRHQMGTIRIFPKPEDNPRTAAGVSYVTVYVSSPGELPLKAEQRVVGEYHDEFVRTADGWKIGKRTFIPVFTE